MAHASLIGMTAAFLVWSGYFVIMYALLSLACVSGAAAPVVATALALVTVATLATLGWIGWRALRAWRAASGPDDARPRFMALTGALGAGLALVATLWVAGPLLLLEPCA